MGDFKNTEENVMDKYMIVISETVAIDWESIEGIEIVRTQKYKYECLFTTKNGHTYKSKGFVTKKQARIWVVELFKKIAKVIEV